MQHAVADFRKEFVGVALCWGRWCVAFHAASPGAIRTGLPRRAIRRGILLSHLELSPE